MTHARCSRCESERMSLSLSSEPIWLSALTAQETRHRPNWPHISHSLSSMTHTAPLTLSFPLRQFVPSKKSDRTWCSVENQRGSCYKSTGLLELLYSLINRWTQQSGACSCWRDHVSARFLMWWWGWERAPWQPLLTGTGQVWGQSPQGSGGHSTCYRFEGWWYWRSLGLSLFLLFQQTQTKISIKCIYMNNSLIKILTTGQHHVYRYVEVVF